MSCISLTDEVRAACVELTGINNVRVEGQAVLYRLQFYSTLRPYGFEVCKVNPEYNKC